MQLGSACKKKRRRGGCTLGEGCRKSGGTPEPSLADQSASNRSSLSRSRTGSDLADSASSSATLRRRSSIANHQPAVSPVRSPGPSGHLLSGSSSGFSASATGRHRASSLLARVSPSLSLANNSRFNSTATLGLRAGLTSPTRIETGSSREHGLGIGMGPEFSRGQGQLPSPPTTASDATSTGSGLTGPNGGSQGSVGSSAARPTRERDMTDPPPSSSTPGAAPATPRRFQVPSIERSSPTVAGNSPRSSKSDSPTKRYSLQSSASSSSNANTVISPSSLRRSGSLRSEIEPLVLSPPSPTHRRTSASANLLPATLPSPDPSTSESDAATLKQGSDDTGSPTRSKGKEREREKSLDTEMDESEMRKARRARRATEAKERNERNQRILDGINQNGGSTPTSPPSSAPASSNGSSPRKRPDTVRRSSTVSAMRSLQLSEDSRSAIFDSSPSSRALRTRASTDEFGLASGSGSVRRRSSTLGKIGEGGSGGESERARRVRTLGHAGVGRDSLDATRSPVGGGAAKKPWINDDLLPQRSYSSMSNYPDGAGAGSRSSRIEWLDREYVRRNSSSTPTPDAAPQEPTAVHREREIERSLRKLSSNERIALQSESSADEDAQSRQREISQTSATSSASRPRPSLPLEFVHPTRSASTRTPARSGTSSPRAHSPRVTSPAFRDRDRTDSPTPYSANRRESFSRASNRTSSSGGNRTKPRAGSGSTSGILGYHLDSGEAEREHERASIARRSISRLRTQSLAEPLPNGEGGRSERDDVFHNGLRTLDDDRRRQSDVPPTPSSAGRIRFAGDTYDRRERSRGTDVGSDAWLEEYQTLQQTGTTRSRASGSSGDAQSSRGLPSGAAPQTPILERDRTIRAINALLTGQGITPEDLAGISHPQTAPGKLGGGSSFDGDSLRRRKSSATEGRVSSPSAPGMTRSKSAMSGNYPRPGTSASNAPGSSEHHKLLHQAFEYFDAHFSPTENRDGMAPDSIELVKRMGGMVASTTKLNSGLRALVAASTEAQIEAQLDETSLSSPNLSAGFLQFEKNINSLLRTSDDQVRSLTEGLIAFTRVERERDKLRRAGDEVNTRPASRASFRGGGPMAMSPKRPATSSPFEGATVSTSSGGRPQTAAARLRDPMEESDVLPRRATQSFSMRSPRSPFLTGYDSPTPIGRRDMATIRSPLSQHERPSTPSTPSSIASPRTQNGLPVPSDNPPQSGIRRSKSSATSSATVRPPTPGGSRLPRSPSMVPVGATALLDQTVAQAGFSPTRSSGSSGSLPRSGGFRAYSETQIPSLQDLGPAPVSREQDRDTWRHTLHSTNSIDFPKSSDSGTDDESSSTTSTSLSVQGASAAAGRAPRQRLSTGSVNLGNAIRSGVSLLRGRRLTNEALPLPTSPHLVIASMSFPPPALAAIAKEVAELLLARRETVGIVETATGGLMSSAILSIPGASGCFRGGVNAYSLPARTAFLKWTKEDTANYAGPTEDIVLKLATNLREVLGTTWAVAESGVADREEIKGPGYCPIAVVGASGHATKTIDVSSMGLDRSGNMVAFAEAGLTALLEALKKEASKL
ncbi:hypothetical protein RQP46_010047 [Phenoliferia psychrophenolica]